MNPKKSNFLKNIFLLFLTLFIMFIFIEFFFRFYGSINNIDFRLYNKELLNSNRLPREMFIFDEKFGFLLKPNSTVLAVTSDFVIQYNINSFGMRDKDYSKLKNEEKFRILAFGDSYTFGEGIDYGKRFTDIIEKNKNIDILNLGIPGMGLDQMVIHMNKKIEEFSSDMVIFFINDVILSRSPIYFDNEDWKQAIKLSQYHSSSENYLNISKFEKSEINQNLLEKSYFFSYINFFINRQLIIKKLQRDDEIEWGSLKRNYNETKNNIIEESKTFVQTDYEKRSYTLLSIAKEIADEKNISFVLIIIDDNNYFNYDNVVPENVDYFNLREVLESSNFPLRFTYDPHYNSHTHALIGEEVTKLLKIAN